jgi:ABC-2 type transport system ATP-binding protein
LKDIRRHEIELTFGAMPPLDAFRSLPGVERADPAADGVTLRLIVQGDIDPVIKLASQHRVVNMVSQEPSLEEIFLRYYRAGDAAGRADDRGVVS